MAREPFSVDVSALADTIARRAFLAPVLAVATAFIGAFLQFGEELGALLGLYGLVPARLLQAVFGFAAGAIDAAAATSIGGLSGFGLLTFAVGVTVVGITFWALSVVVNTVG